MKLLIVEDDPILSKNLVRGFEKTGYIAESALSGTDGEYKAIVNEYDLIILDLNLPGMDGLEVMQHIRKEKPDQRILILSARCDLEDRILGMDLGSNDYMTKPFHFKELEARVRALLRRNFSQIDPLIRCGGLVYDTAKKTAYYGQAELSLTPKELSILEYLLYHKETTVSAEELIDHVWSSEADQFSLSLKTHMSRLRKKLQEQTGSEIISTQRGSGYRITEENAT